MSRSNSFRSVAATALTVMTLLAASGAEASLMSVLGGKAGGIFAADFAPARDRGPEEHDIDVVVKVGLARGLARGVAAFLEYVAALHCGGHDIFDRRSLRVSGVRPPGRRAALHFDFGDGFSEVRRRGV